MIKESWQLSDELLYLLYRHGKNSEKPWLKYRNLKLEVSDKRSGFEGLLLQRLVTKKLVDVRDEEPEWYSSAFSDSIANLRPRPQEYQISLQGLDYVVEELEDSESHLHKVHLGEIDLSVRRYPGANIASAKKSKVDDYNTIPAASRYVSFDHNAPEREEAQKKIGELSDTIAGINFKRAGELARETVVATLKSAQSMLDALELTEMQIKVGLHLTLDSAVQFSKETAQAAKVSLLVEAIKAILKALFTGSNG